jgi:hypothetical protein
VGNPSVPIPLHEVLASRSIRAETAEFRGWKLLKNGELIEAAYTAKFRCIVTQDDDFKKLAAKYLTRFPDLARVGLRLPQTHWKIYKERFIAEWSKTPIQPIFDQIIEWP